MNDLIIIFLDEKNNYTNIVHINIKHIFLLNVHKIEIIV